MSEHLIQVYQDNINQFKSSIEYEKTKIKACKIFIKMLEKAIKNYQNKIEELEAKWNIDIR